MGLQPEMPLPRLGQPQGKVGIGEGEGSLLLAELQIQAGAGGLDVGEARGRAGKTLGGGRSLDVRGLQQQAFDVPPAVGQVDEVYAGLGERDFGELDAVVPQGTYPQVDLNLVGNAGWARSRRRDLRR